MQKREYLRNINFQQQNKIYIFVVPNSKTNTRR